MVSRHPLAGRTIARMNGAGNKILVLDLRGAPVRPAPADARAIHRAPRLDYDQMMVIGDPRTAGTAADVLIYNNDGTLAGACGNGTRCVADRLCRELGVSAVRIETEAGVIACERLGPVVLPGRHGRAAARLGRHSALPRRRRHAAGRSLARWRRTRGARTRLARQHGQSACGVLRPRSQAHRRGGTRREDRSPSDVPGKGQCHFRRGAWRATRSRRGCGSAGSG